MTSQTKELKSQIASMTPEQKAANLSALTYIKTLAAQSNVNIYDWNLLEIFAQEDGINLLLDKKVLNSRFFDQLEKVKKQPKKKEEVDTNNLLNIEIVKTAFVEAAKVVRQNEINQIKNNLYTYEDSVRRSQNALDAALRTYNEATRKITALEQVTDVDGKYIQTLKGIQKIIDEQLWVNPVFENGFLYLNTNTNIMLQEVNKQAKLDLHIDMGQLAVRININEGMRFEVIPYRNNLSVGGFYHPHIQSYGSICWGEASTAAMKAIANLDLEKALRLLHAILNSYNGGSPYMQLARFKLEGHKMTRVADNLKHPDKRRKLKDEDAGTVDTPPATNNPVIGITGTAAAGGQFVIGTTGTNNITF
jgi:hypothetical protein